jgi:quercetin dioxygenase-like cupin family protein
MASPQISGPLWFLDNRVDPVAGREGAFALLELAAHPGDTVPLHTHDEDETFTVLDGELTLQVDGARSVVGAGRSLTVPSGAAHAYLVSSTTAARWLVLTAPGRFAAFVAEVGRPAGDGLPEPSGPPSPEQAASLAEIAARHGIEILGPTPFAH